MTRFERAFKRRTRAGFVTGYSEAPADRIEAIALLLAHVRSLGCTCQPEITLPRLPRHGVLTGVEIAHDDGCPLLQRIEGSQS